MIFSICHGQEPRNNFETSKGKWCFPLSRFQNVDTLAIDCFGIAVNSLDLVLTSQYPAEVRTIQSGKIAEIFKVGDSYTVMVKSGHYFLIYTGLSLPIMKSGEIVAKGVLIGSLSVDHSNGDYSLTLRLMKETKVLNINRWFNWKNACTISF